MATSPEPQILTIQRLTAIAPISVRHELGGKKDGDRKILSKGLTPDPLKYRASSIFKLSETRCENQPGFSVEGGKSVRRFRRFRRLLNGGFLVRFGG
jgi:hypothetical protein